MASLLVDGVKYGVIYGAIYPNSYGTNYMFVQMVVCPGLASSYTQMEAVYGDVHPRTPKPSLH